jgi:general secretion pathway protein F
MSQYYVRIFDQRTGTTSTRLMNAASADEVTRTASIEGVVLSVRARWALVGQRHVRPDIGLFCEELSTLLRAGLNVLEALEALAGQQDSTAAPLYHDLAAELREGRTFSFVLGRRAQDFPAVLTASVRSAERTGNIADALDQYGNFHRAMHDLRRKLVSAAIYPTMVISFGGLVALCLLFFVIPRFASIYSGHGPQPSLVSQILLALSQHMAHYRSAWLAGLSVVVVLLVIAGQSGILKQTLLFLALRVGAIQRWMRLFQMAEVYRSMSMLLRGGFNVVESLALCRDAPAEIGLRRRLAEACRSVEEGSQLSNALHAKGITDSIALRLLTAGEQSGDLPSVLEAIANDYSRRVERRLERAMRVAEPLIMILVGAMVGGLVLLMYMPVFDLASTLS